MRQALTKEAFDFKLACDGYDFVTGELGNKVIGRFGKQYAAKHCKLQTFPGVENFIAHCMRERQTRYQRPRGLPIALCDKYQVGFFETSPDNCTAGFDYILFNQEQLDFWKQVDVDLWGLQFMVCPSRGWDGQINEIGFRILNIERVHNAFKWLFPFGQQATFGLERCTKGQRLLLCEGFQDMIAFRESGEQQAVGLGSVYITEGHKQQLQTEDYLFCQDMDGYGLLVRNDTKLERTCFYAPEGKDPYEVWQKHGFVKPVLIDHTNGSTSS